MKRDPAQLDLLEWQAPQPVERFRPVRVRGASLRTRLKRAMAEALREQAAKGQDRASVAAAMAEWLGSDLPPSALDGWASEARGDQLPNVVRFAALLIATRDQRLLQVLADECGWAVVDRKWLVPIELASLLEHRDEVEKRIARLRAAARASGAL